MKISPVSSHLSFSSNRHITILSFWEGSIDITGIVLTLGTERLLWDPRGLVYWAKLKKILCYRERECWGPWPFISENMSVSVKLSFLGFQCLDLKWRLEDEKKNNWFLLFYIHPRLGHSKNSFSLVNTCWIIPLWLDCGKRRSPGPHLCPLKACSLIEEIIALTQGKLIKKRSTLIINSLPFFCDWLIYPQSECILMLLYCNISWKIPLPNNSIYSTVT